MTLSTNYVGRVLSICTLLGCAAHGAPANDNFAARTTLVGTNVTVTGSNIEATKEAGEPNHAGSSGGRSVWWTWTPPMAGTVVITTLGSSFDTLLGVYAGTSVSALTYIAGNDDDAELTSAVMFDTAAGRTYQIAVDGYGGESGTVKLQVSVGPPPPPRVAPAWYVPDPYGTWINSSSFAGKVVLLNFWATWCGPCKAEMPDMVALQEKYRADGFVILGADLGETAATVRSFLATFTPTINYQIVLANSAMQTAYDSPNAIPTTFLIDRQNFIRKKWVGMQSGATFEKELIPLLYRDTRLSVEMNGSQLIAKWPNTVRSFTLQSCTDVHTSGWTACGPPTVINGTNIVQMPVNGPARFFRLQMSY